MKALHHTSPASTAERRTVITRYPYRCHWRIQIPLLEPPQAHDDLDRSTPVRNITREPFFVYKLQDIMDFPDEIVEQVWQKSQTVEGYDPNEKRKGFAGAWIRRDSYGKTDDYGWEIGHIKPLAKGGADDLDNLWAIHWKNKTAKGEDYPTFKTTVTSNEDKNVEMEIFWTL